MNEVIFSYSRAQAIEDGVLIDVSSTAAEAGIRFPVAVTHAVWEAYVKVPDGITCQDGTGRLWDILWMLRGTVRKAAPGKSSIRYSVLVRNDNRAPRLVTLKAVCGPDDDLSPCITVMTPGED